MGKRGEGREHKSARGERREESNFGLCVDEPNPFESMNDSSEFGSSWHSFALA